MNKITYNTNENISGTSFHCVSIDIIPSLFTKFMNYDDTEFDNYKISKNWTCSYKDNVFTIYDWKMTNLYDDYLPSPDDLWSSDYHISLNIGSKLTSQEDQEFANKLLNDYLNFIKNKKD